MSCQENLEEVGLKRFVLENLKFYSQKITLTFRNGRDAKKKRKSARGEIVRKKRNEKQKKTKKKLEKRN